MCLTIFLYDHYRSVIADPPTLCSHRLYRYLIASAPTFDISRKVNAAFPGRCHIFVGYYKASRLPYWILHVSLLAVLNAMPLGSRLYHCIPGFRNVCRCCGLPDDTIRHVFRDCAFVQYLVSLANSSPFCGVPIRDHIDLLNLYPRLNAQATANFRFVVVFCIYRLLSRCSTLLRYSWVYFFTDTLTATLQSNIRFVS